MPRYETYQIIPGFIYSTEEEAKQAAQRMMDRAPGTEFCVRPVLNSSELQALQAHLSSDEAQNIEDKRLAGEDDSPYGGAMYCQG